MVKRKLDPGQKIKLKLFAQTHNASKESKVVLELRSRSCLFGLVVNLTVCCQFCVHT